LSDEQFVGQSYHLFYFLVNQKNSNRHFLTRNPSELFASFIVIIDLGKSFSSRQENEMASLRKEVESFPKRSEATVKAAMAETTERLTRDFKSDKALMEARFEGERNVLLGKVEALEKMVASQAAQISDLSKKNELAYEKVQDIANRAVTASRREIYPAPAPHATVAVRDNKND
jgi:hypothetical protein